MKKECQVVLLPTNKKSNLQLNVIHKHLFEGGGAKIPTQPYQHLYICSQEEIKEEDWVLYNIHSNGVFQGYNKYDEKTIVSQYNPAVHQNIRYCKKIIATTDNSLNENWMKENPPFSAPYNKAGFINNIPQQFITQYIEEYNKGNIITSVMVEYGCDCGISDCIAEHTAGGIPIPKLNGNEIIINN